MNKPLFLFALLIGFFYSCDEINFEQPQPYDGVKLSSVPKTLHGTWVSESDSILIDESGMTRITHSTEQLAKSEVTAENGFRMEKDLIYLPHDPITGQRYSEKGDSIFVFSRKVIANPLSEELILQSADDFYVASYLERDENWQLLIITVSKKGEIVMYTPSVKKFKSQFKEGYTETIYHDQNRTQIDCRMDLDAEQIRKLISKKNMIFKLKTDGTYDDHLPFN